MGETQRITVKSSVLIVILLKSIHWESLDMPKLSMEERIMFRLTIYENDGEKTVDEFGEIDDLRITVDNAVDDIERKTIKTFSVSWISEKPFREKPFWEK